ncbi:MAG: iron-containing alcohol dehydrogenase [Syntrophorhabdales bacterium]|jgi:alcohol dehydrogenase class IV
MAYEFLGPRKIVAGENALASVPAEVRSLKGTRPLIVTDAGIARSGLLARLTSVLDEQKMTHGIFSEVEPDPDIAVAEKGKKAFVEGHYDLLIAFGGGSSIDAAKTISFLARNEGGVKDYVGMAVFKNAPVPVVAIPTTAGTGSEVTQIAIVTDKDQKLKLPIRSPHLFPKTAILDATLLTSLPPDVIAYTGMDAFSHAVESFFSTRSNLLTEQLSASAVRLIYPSLIPFRENPKDADLASRMLHGSCLAGIAFTNGGLGAVHALAHPIGSHYHLSHGLTCALFLHQVLEENKDAVLDKYRVLLGTLGISAAALSAEACAERFIEAVDEFMDRLGIPRKLSSMGIKHEVQPMMIEDAMRSPALMANPKKLDREKIEALLLSVR